MLMKDNQKRKRGWQNIRTLIAGIFIVVGIGLMLVNPVKHYLMHQTDDVVQTELHELTPEAVKQAEETPATYNYDDISEISLGSILQAKKEEAKAPMIGEIAIPEVGINLPILKGVTNQNLLLGAATMKPDQKMGVGNYTLASHYSDAYNETLLFAPLKRASVDMMVYLTDLTNVYTYQITSIRLVDATEVSVLDETGENILTLVTCKGLDGIQRRIVRGKLVNITPVDKAPKALNDVFKSSFKTY